MGHLVGQHPVLAEAQHRIAHLVGEVAHRREDVDGEALECTVHAGETEHRVGVAGSLEQRDGLGVLADLGAHVVAELDRDLDVAGFVPALPSHVELQREGDLVEVVVVGRAAGALEGLDLADEDAVHLAAGAIGHILGFDEQLAVFADAGPWVVEPLGGRDAVEPIITSQGVGWDQLAHAPIVPKASARGAGEGAGSHCRRPRPPRR